MSEIYAITVDSFLPELPEPAAFSHPFYHRLAELYWQSPDMIHPSEGILAALRMLNETEILSLSAQLTDDLATKDAAYDPYYWNGQVEGLPEFHIDEASNDELECIFKNVDLGYAPHRREHNKGQLICTIFTTRFESDLLYGVFIDMHSSAWREGRPCLEQETERRLSLLEHANGGITDIN